MASDSLSDRNSRIALLGRPNSFPEPTIPSWLDRKLRVACKKAHSIYGNQLCPLGIDSSGRCTPRYEPSQYAEYREGGHYSAWHTDADEDESDITDLRCVTIVLMVSDSDAYEGGALEVRLGGGAKKSDGGGGDVTTQVRLRAGDAVAFPSKHLWHRGRDDERVAADLVFWASQRRAGVARLHHRVSVRSFASRLHPLGRAKFAARDANSLAPVGAFLDRPPIKTDTSGRPTNIFCPAPHPTPDHPMQLASVALVLLYMVLPTAVMHPSCRSTHLPPFFGRIVRIVASTHFIRVSPLSLAVLCPCPTRAAAAPRRRRALVGPDGLVAHLAGCACSGCSAGLLSAAHTHAPSHTHAPGRPCDGCTGSHAHAAAPHEEHEQQRHGAGCPCDGCASTFELALPCDEE